MALGIQQTSRIRKKACTRATENSAPTKQAEIEKLHFEKDKALLENSFRQAAENSLSSDTADTNGSSDTSPPRTKQARIGAGSAPTQHATATTTRAPAVLASASVDNTACMPVVSATAYDSSTLLSVLHGNTVPSLSTVCTPVYAQCAMTRPSPSVLPYATTPVCQAPGQSANPIINFVVQPPGSQLFTGSGSGSVNVVGTSGPSLVGLHSVSVPPGFDVNTVSQPASLASQSLFTQSSVSLGAQILSAQSSATPTCADAKATPIVVASSSPESSIKSGDSLSLCRRLSCLLRPAKALRQRRRQMLVLYLLLLSGV